MAEPFRPLAHDLPVPFWLGMPLHAEDDPWPDEEPPCVLAPLGHIYGVADMIPGVHDLWARVTQVSAVPLVYFLMVTPALAAHWLADNSTAQNRKYRPHTATRYAQDMRAHCWHLTCQGIEFAPDGTLLNGQHRLRAIVLAQQAHPLLVGFQVRQEAIRVIDTNALRSLADTLTIEGEKNTNILASVTRLLYIVEQVGGFQGINAPGVQPTRSQALAYLAAHPGIRDVVPLCKAAEGFLPKSLVGALYYLTHTAAATEADLFWTHVIDGVGLAATDVRYRLREWVLRNRAGSRRMTEPYLIVGLIKGWNIWYRGSKTASSQSFTWRTQGDAPEPFPTLLL